MLWLKHAAEEATGAYLVALQRFSHFVIHETVPGDRHSAEECGSGMAVRRRIWATEIVTLTPSPSLAMTFSFRTSRPHVCSPGDRSAPIGRRRPRGFSAALC